MSVLPHLLLLQLQLEPHLCASALTTTAEFTSLEEREEAADLKKAFTRRSNKPPAESKSLTEDLCGFHLGSKQRAERFNFCFSILLPFWDSHSVSLLQ